jgi:hypothetical protein
MRGRRGWGAARVLVFAWMLVRAANAQERLHFEEVPDRPLYETTLQHEGDPTTDARLSWFGSAAGVTEPALDMTPSAALSMGLGLGLWSSPRELFQLHSETLRPDSLASSSSAPLRLSDFEGAHRARAFLALGEVAKDETGIDLELEGTLLHGAPTTTSFLRRDLPVGAAFTDATFRATAWPRFGSDSTEAYVMPLSYAHRDVGYDTGGGGGGGYTSDRVSSGFGIRPYDRETSHGWFQIAGVGWEKARFDGGLAPARLGGVDRIDLRLVDAETIFAELDRGVTLGGSAYVGGSWLWDPVTHREMSAFTFALASTTRIDIDDDHHDAILTESSVSRRAGFLADATAMTRSWRFESGIGVTLKDDRLGGSFRSAVEQLAIAPLSGDDYDAGWRESFATEWYFAVVPHVKLGFFHVATNRCAPRMVGADGDFCQQLGAFVRIEEKWASKEEKEEERVGAPAAEPAPPATPPSTEKPLDPYDLPEDMRPRY